MSRSPLTAPISALPARPPLPRLSVTLANATKLVRTWKQRARSRTALRNLDPHLLKDIGLTEAAVHAETTKDFWQA